MRSSGCESSAVKRTDHRLPPADAMGLSLFVRQARPCGPCRGTVVLVHGATLASGLWDIAVPGYSMLEALAGIGYSVWAPDIRGYARSGRLSCPNAPYAGLHEAVRDIAAVVDHACHADGTSQVMVLGGSWGSITVARYATEQPRRVRALALVAPIYATPNALWLSELSSPGAAGQLRADLGATRRVGRADLCRRWDPEIPGGAPSLRRDDRVLDALMADALAAEPDRPDGTHSHDTFGVPNGTLQDLFESFSGRPLYEPALLPMPVLLVRGEDDQTSTAIDMLALQQGLVHSQVQCETLPDAGHFICAERAAPVLQRLLGDFLARHSSPRPAGAGRG